VSPLRRHCTAAQRRVLRQNILNTIVYTIPRGPRGKSNEHRGGATAPWERGRLARWRPLRVHDTLTPASRWQQPHPTLDTLGARSPPGRRSAGVSPALQRTAGAAAPRVRRLAAHGSAATAPLGARASRPLCNEPHRAAHGPVRAGNGAAGSLTGGTRQKRPSPTPRCATMPPHGCGGTASATTVSPLVPRSSFLAAVFLLSAPAVQDRVHDSVARYTPRTVRLQPRHGRPQSPHRAPAGCTHRAARVAAPIRPLLPGTRAAPPARPSHPARRSRRGRPTSRRAAHTPAAAARPGRRAPAARRPPPPGCGTAHVRNRRTRAGTASRPPARRRMNEERGKPKVPCVPGREDDREALSSLLSPRSSLARALAAPHRRSCVTVGR
jgi:hypothetical protein